MFLASLNCSGSTPQCKICNFPHSSAGISGINCDRAKSEIRIDDKALPACPFQGEGGSLDILLVDLHRPQIGIGVVPVVVLLLLDPHQVACLFFLIPTAGLLGNPFTLLD